MASKPKPPPPSFSALTAAMFGGKGMEMSDIDQEPTFFSSGLGLLDRILNGGFAEGRMTEIFGPNKSGKTELSRSIAHSYLSEFPDSEVWYFDQEFALDNRILNQYPMFAARHSDGNKRFKVLYAECLEEFLSTLFKAFTTAEENGIKKVRILVVLDSVPALKARQAVDQVNVEEKLQLLPEARLWSEQTSKLRRYLNRFGAHAILVNQTREKPNTQTFEPESPGGSAIKFYADTRLFLTQVSRFSFSKGKAVPKGYRPSGFFTKIRVRKNKLGMPERELEVPVTYQASQGVPSGISQPWAVFYCLLERGVIKSKGGAFVMRGIDERFNRSDWVAMYQDFRANPESPGGVALTDGIESWVQRQLAADDGKKGADDDEGDDDLSI